MNIPILIVHKGNTFYLPIVLRQLRLFNPNSRICLISDESTKCYEFVEHYDIKNYSEGLIHFGEIYKHRSSNPYDYELFCFQRWFVINDFVKENGLQDFLCMDSDVLFYCSVDDVFNKYLGCDFTICNKLGPGCSLFNVDSIKSFCDYMMLMYTSPSYINKMDEIYENLKSEKKLGGICDMTAFVWYQENVKCNVIDIAIPVEGICFDGCITWSAGFEMENGKKKIYWNDNLPYGKQKCDNSLIRFNCLHFQGRSKYSMFRYILDNNKVHNSGFWYDLKWLLSKDILNARLKGVKKAINNPKMVVNFVRTKLK